MKSHSTAGLEKRKPSTRVSSSAKSSPVREMAPFFSIFYRGLGNKINRSQSKAQLDVDREQRAKGQQQQEGGLDRAGSKAFLRTSFASEEGLDRMGGKRPVAADKPPLPKGGSQKRSTTGHQQHGDSRSRSTVDLAKEKALAEGRMWREQQQQQQHTGPAEGLPPSPKPTKRVCSAPGSPQTRTRRWSNLFFGSFSSKGEKARSHEPAAAAEQTEVQQRQMMAAHGPNGGRQQQNGLANGGREREQPEKGEKGERKRQSQSQPQGTAPLSFAQRIKLHKGVRTGKMPVDALKGSQRASIIPRAGEKYMSGKKAAKGQTPYESNVYLSADAINELNKDPEYIAEVLRTLGDEQPRVARSTPKHAAPSHDPRKVHERLRKNCLYPETVYDKMVKDSILVCDLLQSHLDEVISGVRARSPAALCSPFTTPPGSPFLARSISMQPFPGAPPISRLTISVSPMAQQANPNLSPRPSASLPPPFPTGSSPPFCAPPMLQITPPSRAGSERSKVMPPKFSSDKRLQFMA